MISALAIVDTAADAARAASAGFDRIAWRTEASAMMGQSLALRAVDAVAGFLVSDLAGCPVDPGELVRMALAAGSRTIWLPLDGEGRRFCEAATAAGLPTTGVILPTHALDRDSYRAAAELGLRGLLLMGQTPGERIVDRMGIAALASAIALCHDHDLSVALAGGLEPADVPRLLALGPDELGFDKILGDAAGRFDEAASRAILGLLRPSVIPPHATAVTEAERDRIFVRDWTVTMGIGVYARERGVAQRVRFNIEAELAPAPTGATGLAGIVSYDLITDAITRLAADHVDLVEDLAERLAAFVLAHPRVAKVDVMVEKLDVGPGSLGCRIVRERPRVA